MATKKGALAEDPKKGGRTPKDWVEVAKRMFAKYKPGTEKHKQAQTILNRYGPTSGVKNWEAISKTPYGGNTGNKQPTPFNQLAPEKQFNQVGDEVGQTVIDQFNRIQQQGAFNPGDYNDTYQQAFNNVMGQFNLQNQPVFERQNKDVEQMIAERGWDPTGEAANELRSNMYRDQDMARQQSMYQAEQYGRQLQQQRFDNDLTQYNVPAAQLQAFAPYYGGMADIEGQRQGAAFLSQQQADQRAWQGSQAELDRQNQQRIASMNRSASPDPFALATHQSNLRREENREQFYDNNVTNLGR